LLRNLVGHWSYVIGSSIASHTSKIHARQTHSSYANPMPCTMLQCTIVPVDNLWITLYTLYCKTVYNVALHNTMQDSCQVIEDPGEGSVLLSLFWCSLQSTQKSKNKPKKTEEDNT